VSEPRQKPGRSKQDYRTPAEFLAAVRAYLEIDDFAFDFATDGSNAVAANYFLDDALGEDWPAQLPGKAWGWINPPFARIEPWVKKAYEASSRGARIAVLVPAGVGANWWRDWVDRKADVLFLNGRITFDGTSINPKTGKPDPYPKDCALLLFSPSALAMNGSYDVWPWKAPRQPVEQSA
jgi:phage N-6-adenine-methyltransferase